MKKTGRILLIAILVLAFLAGGVFSGLCFYL